MEAVNSGVSWKTGSSSDSSPKNDNSQAEFSFCALTCTLGSSPAPAFVDDFPSDAHKFNQRTFHVRLINLCTSDKKSSHKIRHKETPRVHAQEKEENHDEI